MMEVIEYLSLRQIWVPIEKPGATAAGLFSTTVIVSFLAYSTW